jgi:1-deoxy-D-xylulose-5-phosphate reductoisomerase
MKNLAILGSTGSIGRSTLAVVETFPERFQVVSLAAGHNTNLLRSQIRRHSPAVVSVAERSKAQSLAAEFPNVKVCWGTDGLAEVGCQPDVHMVVVALVGAVGLLPTLKAIRAGKDIALANKEVLVMAGTLVMREVAEAKVDLLPVDSEHNAIHQALRAGAPEEVQRLILTASGGPFRNWPAERIAEATVADALAHPTWKMGAKITVDSATMMNKGLEIIEAHHLFGIPERQIDVLVHPESLVHSFVEYRDGALIAQLSINDMRLPILYALTWPNRIPSPLPSLDLAEAANLSFERPDSQRFPALGLARAALRSSGEMPAVLNAANETAVRAFLDGSCAFGDIAVAVRTVMEQWDVYNRALECVEQVVAADRKARAMTNSMIGKYSSTQKGSQ